VIWLHKEGKIAV